MKTPLLLAAAFAAAAGLPAADLKDPRDVAREWNRTAAAARDPLTDTSLSLTTEKRGERLTIESGFLAAQRDAALRQRMMQSNPSREPFAKRYDWPEGHPYFPLRKGTPLPYPFNDFKLLPLGGPHY